MSFWDHVITASGMGRGYPWVLLGIVVVALLLALLRPEAHARLRATVLLIASSFLGILICAAIRRSAPAVGSGGNAAERYIHFAAQLLLAAALINLGGVLLFRVLLRSIKLEPAPILRDAMIGVSYIVVALTLLARHGVDLSGIVATSAVVTAVIGFSLQDTLGNVMGGVALQMERSIEVGDWVKVGEVEGVVRETRWRQTSIETRNGDTVVIPNSALMKSQVTVLGKNQKQPALHRIAVEFNVDFRHAPSDVIDTVTRALRTDGIENIAAAPPPDCLLIDFRESYGRYAARFWVANFGKESATASEVRTRVFVALQRAGMKPSIPAQSVFLTMENRARAERKRREDQERRATALKSVALLSPLTDEERHDLARRLSVAPFRHGEIITRQGNEAHYLYILTKGEVEVRVAVPPNGESRLVGKLSAYDVFGETGMLTGEPRSATVVAVTDVVCYRLDKEAFQVTLERRPEIAEAISHLLARRKVELQQVMNGPGTGQPIAATQRDLLQRIRHFFRLGNGLA